MNWNKELNWTEFCSSLWINAPWAVKINALQCSSLRAKETLSEKYNWKMYKRYICRNSMELKRKSLRGCLVEALFDWKETEMQATICRLSGFRMLYNHADTLEPLAASNAPNGWAQFCHKPDAWVRVYADPSPPGGGGGNWQAAGAADAPARRLHTVPYEGDNFANYKMDKFSTILKLWLDGWMNFLKIDWNFFNVNTKEWEVYI